MDIAAFRRLPLLGILRGIPPEAVDPLAETVARAGLAALEITMNTPGAPALISRMVSASRGRFAVGAGTVTGLPGLETALGAGASFIVSPVVVPEVIERCAARAVPVFPGALTPQEIWQAWKLGATMVKVFPAGFFGPKYFAEIRGPFGEIGLLACGGVTSANMGEYFACGADAVAFGASIFRREWIASGDYASIERSVRAFVDGCARRGK